MKSVLLIDGIGPEAKPILTEAKLRVVDAKKGFKKELDSLYDLIIKEFSAGELLAICLRSGTNFDKKAMVVLRQYGVELIVRFGTGMDNIDYKAAAEMGIIVENTPGQNAISVAEKTIICAGALCHKINLPIARFAAIDLVKKFIPSAQGYVEKGNDFANMADNFLKGNALGNSDCNGSELYGKTMGIIGCCGAIGLRVSVRAMSFGMKVLGFDTRHRVLEAEGVRRVKTLNEIFKESDFITVHVPLDSKTLGLIGMEEIIMMKKGVFILNLAREGIVDVNAVDANLTNGFLGGYASDLDDPSDSVFRHPNTIVMPHIGAKTKESEARCATVGSQQVVSWFLNGDIVNGFNFPEMSLGGQQKNGQLTVIHRDTPGLIESLSGYFRKHQINIGPFHTEPQNGFACTMIGPDKPFNEKIVADLAAMKDVIRVMPLVR